MRRKRDPNQTASLEDYWGNDDVGFATSWGPSTSGGTISWSQNTCANDTVYAVPLIPGKVQNEAERLFEKGKFFAFESSREFRAWFGGPKTPVKLFKSRHGFQQMARIPNYRGVRTR